MFARLAILSGLLLALAAHGRGAEPASAAASSPKRPVILVFKTHFDIGFTDLAANVVHGYRTEMIDKALEVCEQNRCLASNQRFVWTVPGWPLKTILEDWEGQTAQRKSRLIEALREGQIVVHGLPFSTHTELLEPEDLVRGLGYSSALARALEQPLPRDAKMTDVPCHTWFVPTLLRHAGIEFLHIGCNGASNPARVPPLFWWEGPDGSRLLTMYSPEYGTGLTPPEDWPYRTWLALLHAGDNAGPPKPEEIPRILSDAQQRMPEAEIRIGRLSDFADAVRAEQREIPVVRGDMPDSWIHGPMSDPAGASTARTIRPWLPAAEALQRELQAWNVPVHDASDAIRAAYEASLLYDEHTWGGDIGWIGGRLSYGDQWRARHDRGEFTRLEASWAEHTAYIERAKQTISPVLEGDLRLLAESVNISGVRLVVFNPLPWKRSGMVEVPCAMPVTAVKPADGAKTVAVEAIGASRRFFARDIPPLGYRTYVPADSPAKGTRVTEATSPAETAPQLDTPFFVATLDPEGLAVRSLVDKRTGRELVDATAPFALGQFLHEYLDADQTEGYVKAYVRPGCPYVSSFQKPQLPSAQERPYRALSPRGETYRIEHTPLADVAVMHAEAAPEGQGLSYAVTTRLIMYREQPWVDLEVTLHDKPADPWPEAGWICLPLRVDTPQFRLGRLGSIVDPAHDVITGGNRHLFTLNTGMTVTDPQGLGVGLCPLDHPLVSLETPGCWKYSLDFVPQKPLVFINFFNNQWSTNFRFWNSGTWTSRVRLWSVEKAEAESALITPSLESRSPLLAAAVEAPAGSLPTTRAGLELSRRGVSVTAFGGNPDGPGTILRLWELAGQRGPCQIHLPEGMRPQTVQPVDLRGRPQGEPVKVVNGAWTVELTPFAPLSFVIAEPSAP